MCARPFSLLYEISRRKVARRQKGFRQIIIRDEGECFGISKVNPIEPATSPQIDLQQHWESGIDSQLIVPLFQVKMRRCRAPSPKVLQGRGAVNTSRPGRFNKVITRKQPRITAT